MSEIWAWLLKYPQVLAGLITFTLGVLLQLVLRVFAAKPRLRWGQTSDTIFLVPITPAPAQNQIPTGAITAPPTEGDPLPAAPAQLPARPLTGVGSLPEHHVYRSRTIWLVNSGTAIAEDLEIAFNWAPQHLEWYPHLPLTVTRQPDARYILTIGRLNPKEGVTLSLLSLNQEHPLLMHVRCKGFQGKQIPFRAQQVFPWWIQGIVAILMFLGAYTVVSILVAVALAVTTGAIPTP